MSAVASDAEVKAWLDKAEANLLLNGVWQKIFSMHKANEGDESLAKVHAC